MMQRSVPAPEQSTSLKQDCFFAELADIVERRPVDLSHERILRDREAMEHAVIEILNRPGPRKRRLSRFGLILGFSLVGLAIVSVWSALPAPAADRIEGRATVTDGDTIAVEGTKARIRLYGIDAPESGQTCDDAAGKRYLCGTRAADHLAGLIGRSGRVTCFEEDRDRYGRIVAECVTPGNVVINAEMVRAGWAVEYDQYSDGRYDREEATARSAKRGMWQGEFVEPSKWRRGDRLQTERVADGQPAGCAIKGNISSSGRIYHVPGQQNYARTQIDEKAGERWFCSPKEAETAGWRAAKR